jgi:hypothetical protein
LHHAIDTGDAELILILLKYEANIKLETSQPHTLNAFDFAIIRWEPEIASLIDEDMKKKSSAPLTKNQDKDKWTQRALFWRKEKEKAGSANKYAISEPGVQEYKYVISEPGVQELLHRLQEKPPNSTIWCHLPSNSVSLLATFIVV